MYRTRHNNPILTRYYCLIINVVFLSLSAIILPSIAWSGNQLEPNQQLRSASEFDYPPFCIVKDDGTAGGFSVELLRAAVEAAGLSVSFKVGPWEQLKRDLATGVLEVLPLVSYSKERDMVYDFTAPYLKMNGTVFVRRGNTEITNISQLQDKEVLVMQGDTAHEYVVAHHLSKKIIPTVSYEDAFKLLAKGKHDAVVVQQIVGLQIIKKLQLKNIIAVEKQHITTLKPVALQLEGFEQNFCFAVQEGNHQLLSMLNEGLTVLYLNGTYEALYQKWFSPILPPPLRSAGQIVKELAMVIIPFALVFTLWGLWYMRKLVAKRTQFLLEEIEQRQRIERKLERSNKAYLKAQEIGKVGNWEFTLATDKFYGSLEARKIYGLDTTSSTFTAEAIENCIPDKKQIRQAMVDLIEKNIPYDLEFDIITADTGEKRTITSRAEIIRDTTGKPIKIRGVVQDITERRNMKERLQQAQKLESVGVLAGGIAHDFNNILSAILGFTELAKESHLSDLQLQDDLNEIYTAGSRAKELVQQLLTFSRTEERTTTPLDITIVVKETIRIIQAISPTSIQFDLDIDDTVRPVLADPTQIHQITTNLCNNAVQSMKNQNGTLNIHIAETTLSPQQGNNHGSLPPGDYIKLIFQDTGKGISPEIIGSIFDPYFTTRRFGDSSGLGLAVTYGNVKKIGGDIFVTSELNRGTTFTILLPILDRSEPPPKKDLTH